MIMIFRLVCFTLVAMWWMLAIPMLPLILIEVLIRDLAGIPHAGLLHELDWVYLKKPQLLYEHLIGEVK